MRKQEKFSQKEKGKSVKVTQKVKTIQQKFDAKTQVKFNCFKVRLRSISHNFEQLIRLE